MKKAIFILLSALIVLGGCQPKGSDTPDETGKVVRTKQKAKKKKKKSISFQPQAGGAPYELLVLMDDAQWDRPVGRALYEVLDTDLPGVAQPERQFRMTRIAPSNFGNMFKVFRNIVQTDIQTIYSSAKFKFTRDVYARGQMVMTLQAHDEEQLTAFLQKNGQQLLDFFTRAEFNRQVDIWRRRTTPPSPSAWKSCSAAPCGCPWNSISSRRARTSSGPPPTVARRT